MVNDDQPTHSLHRAMRMGRLGFNIAGSYLGYQVQNLFLDAEAQKQKRQTFQQKSAQRIREELQSLRGPVMKLGQTLSMQSHLIPEDMIQELAELQMHAPSMHPTLMRTQFKKSLGKYPEEIFARFDMEPFAAASLGQVHYAVTPSGEEVAVKIQYPAIRQAVENDFSLLRSVTLPARIVKYVPDEMLDEVEKGILLETDYLNEARNIDFFRENLKELSYVHVPKIFPQYTTDKVLTMSFMRGEFLEQRLGRSPSQRWKDHVGARLFELFVYQFLRMEAIHADPHPGNYLYDEDGSIALLDFGCVKYVPSRLVHYSRWIEERVWEQDEGKYAELMKGIFGEQTDPDNEGHRRVMDSLIEFQKLFSPNENRKHAVDFGEKILLARMTALWNDALKNQLSQPDMFFLCRAELGLYNVLYRLGAKVRTTEISERILRMNSDRDRR